MSTYCVSNYEPDGFDYSVFWCDHCDAKQYAFERIEGHSKLFCCKECIALWEAEKGYDLSEEE